MLGRKNIAILLAVAMVLFVPNLLFGATLSTSKTEEVLEGIRIAFVAICGVTTVILVIFTGFKLYQGQTLPELIKLLWMIAAFGTSTALGEFVDSFMQ
ncbi:hypothetical protein CRU92_00670 [Arcobacter sp. FW59]|nr:hypothetical protein CRU92_00670 [Arcobacter sp. FW59]